MGNFGAFFQDIYFSSQIALAAIALVAAFIAYRQLHHFKVFELVKYIEDPDVRKSRQILWDTIRPHHTKDWWTSDSDGSLVRAASRVAASYDVVARFLQNDETCRRFFINNWDDNIIWTHIVLDSYLRHRRSKNKDAYIAYTSLYELAFARKSDEEQEYYRAERLDLPSDDGYG